MLWTHHLYLLGHLGVEIEIIEGHLDGAVMSGLLTLQSHFEA